MKTPQFEFATDEQARRLLQRDYEELKSCLKAKAWKAAIILEGSILEMALLESMKPQRAFAEAKYQTLFPKSKPKTLEEMELFEFLSIARELKVLSSDKVNLCDSLREYRNLIHPGVEIRKKLQPTKELANLGGGALDLLVSKLAEAPEGLIYLLSLRGSTRHWVDDPIRLSNFLSQLLTSGGKKFVTITEWNKWDELVRNPTSHAIIVNTHGELVPMPSSWQGDWKTFFKKLAENAQLQGWTIAMLTGYPFWHVVDETKMTLAEVGYEGLNTFLGVLGASGNCMNQRTASLTPEALRRLRKLQSTFPASLTVSRCAKFDGVQVSRSFVTDGKFYGVCVIRVGRGGLYHQGVLPPDFGLSNQATQATDQNLALMLYAFLLS